MLHSFRNDTNSACAINNNHVKVTFNKEIDPTTAVSLANYKIDGVALTATQHIVLGTDKKSVEIYNVGGRQDQKVIFAVENVLASDFTKIKAHEGEITFRDVVNPTVVSAKLEAGNKEIVLEYSEQVVGSTGTGALNPLAYTIDGQPLSTFGGAVAYETVLATQATPGSAATKLNVVRITLATALTPGEHTVVIKDEQVRDGAGFFATGQKATVTAAVDPTALAVVSSKATVGGTVEVTFNKDLGDVVAGYRVNDGSANAGLKQGTKNTIIVTGSCQHSCRIWLFNFFQNPISIYSKSPSSIEATALRLLA